MFGTGGLFLSPLAPGVLQTVSTNLAVDVVSGAQPPVYSTLLTAVMTTVLASSYLDIRTYVAMRMLGGGFGRKAPNIRLRLNGVLIPASRGMTENEVSGAIMTMAMERRLVVSAGIQTVIVEWAYFGPVGATMNCTPVTLPDLEGAQLVIQEQR